MLINNRIARRRAIFARSPSFRRWYYTRRVEENTCGVRFPTGAKKTHSLRPLRSSVTRVYGGRNKRAELIKNFGHARVGSFVVARYVPTRSCAKSQFRLPTRSRTCVQQIRAFVLQDVPRVVGSGPLTKIAFRKVNIFMKLEA